MEDYLAETPLIDPASMSRLASSIVGTNPTLISAATAVTQWVYKRIEYKKGVTSVVTTARQVVETRQGVCQDKTHLALGLLRALGIPCRYVSGLLTEQPGDTHAWLEFRHPSAGWLPTDPTKGKVIGLGFDYLKLGVGLDYTDVPPVTGSFVSSGAGRLDRVFACVKFDRDDLTVEEAIPLLGLNMKEVFS